MRLYFSEIIDETEHISILLVSDDLLSSSCLLFDAGQVAYSGDIFC